MKTLPNSVTAYKKTPVFTEQTVPAALLKDHSTKEGVWGKIVILEGELDYTILDPEQETLRLSAAHHGIIAPQSLHHVTPVSSVRFYVEFHRAD